MKYRSRTDIIGMMLRAALDGGATKTHLMYSAYLSYAQLNEYITALTEKELLKYDAESRVFKITEKGMAVLRAYDELERLMNAKGS